MPFKCVVPGCRSNYYHVRGTPSVPMMRFPLDPDLLTKWLQAICRTDFTPTPYSHVCIRHFPDDQLIWHEYQKRTDGFSQRARRRFAKLRPNAVPSVFEVDPSTHKVRSRLPLVKSRVPKVKARCEILTKSKAMSFKSETWEDMPQKPEEEKEIPTKRPRGRPRKYFKNILKKDDGVIVKSEFVSCCALGCPNTSESYIMNCLPRDAYLKNTWVEKIDRLDWSPDDDSALCEVHFEADCWEMGVGEEKILRDDAVPTLYLHGEAIKSWVTLDNSGSMEDVLCDQNNGDDEEDEEQRSESEEEDPEVIVKREVLEPEIDMVEGSEDVLSQDTSSTEEQFETIYCDSTFNEDEEDSNDVQHSQEASSMDLDEPRSDLENPLNLESIASEDRQIQDRQVSCMADSEVRRNASNFLVISQPQYKRKKVIKRRSSSMLNDDFQCPICERRLSRRKNLEIHMEKLHPNGELSDYQKKKKMENFTTKVSPVFKKPPPPLAPLVPSCLLTSPILPSPKPPPTLLATTMVTAPSPLDQNPAGGELKKQFLLLLPKPMEPHSNPVPAPPTTALEQPKIPKDDAQIFSVNLCHISMEKRAALKEKLRELVEAVMSKNLDPKKIIIAYDRT